MCVYTISQQSRRHEEEEPKKWTALCVAAWILVCVIGDHLSAGHLVRQIEMWLPFRLANRFPFTKGMYHQTSDGI